MDGLILASLTSSSFSFSFSSSVAFPPLLSSVDGHPSVLATSGLDSGIDGTSELPCSSVTTSATGCSSITGFDARLPRFLAGVLIPAALFLRPRFGFGGSS